MKNRPELFSLPALRVTRRFPATQLTLAQGVLIVILWALTVALTVILNRMAPLTDLQDILFFIVVCGLSALLAIRLPMGVPVGLINTSLIATSLALGYERAMVVGLAGMLVVGPAQLLVGAWLGTASPFRQTTILEILWNSAAITLSLLAASWLYERAGGSTGLLHFDVGDLQLFLSFTVVFFAITHIFRTLWLGMRSPTSDEQKRGPRLAAWLAQAIRALLSHWRHYWQLLSINFLTLAFAPFISLGYYIWPNVRLLSLIPYGIGVMLLYSINRAFLSLSYRVADLRVLNSIGQALNATLDLDSLANAIYREIGTLADVSGFYLALYDQQNNTISFPLAYGAGQLSSVDPRPFANGLTEYIIRTRRPLLLNRDAIATARKMGIQPITVDVGGHSRSYLGVPVLAEDQVIGVLALRNYEHDYAFSQDDLRLLETVASQAGVALRNAQLYSQSQRQSVELSSLHRVSLLVGATLELDQVLRNICKVVMDVLHCQKAAVFLLDDKDDTILRLVDSIGLSERFKVRSATIDTKQSRALAFRTGTVVAIEDILADPRFTDIQNIVRAEGIRAVLDAPLRLGDRVIGTLAAYHDQPRRIDRSEMELMLTLSGQVAIAVENARLFEATLARSHELETLYHATAAINVSLSLKNVLQAVEISILRALRLDSCTTLLALGDEQTLRVEHRMILASDGNVVESATRLSELSLHELPAIHSAIKRQDTLLLHSSDAALSQGEHNLMEHCDLRAGMVLPLVVHGEMVGLIVAGAQSERIFKPTELHLAEALANQAAVAIENARLFERVDVALARRVDELGALKLVSQRMTRRLDLQSVIEQVVYAAAAATSAEYCEVALLDEQTETLRAIVRQSHSEWQSEDIWFATTGITGRALRSGESVLVDDVLQDPDYIAGHEDVRSELVVPVKLEDRLLGVINLESVHPGAFNEDHARFVTSLAEYAAVAIENARLYESERRQRQIAEMLLETSAAIASSLDLGQVLLAVARQLLKISGFHRCVLYEWDQERERVFVLAEHARTVWTPDGGEAYTVAEYKTTERVLTTGKPALVYIGMDNPDEAELVWLQDAGLMAVWIFPLRAGDEIIGLAEVGGVDTSLAFDQQIPKRCRGILQDAASWLSTPLLDNQEQALLELAGRLAVMSGGMTCALSAWYPEEGVVRTTAEYCDLLWPPTTKQAYHRITSSVWGDVLKNGTPAIVRLSDPDIAPIDREGLTKWGLRMSVIQPLLVKGQPIGLVELTSVTEEQQVSADELQLWRAVVDQAAVAIENARLFEAVQRRAEEFNTLRAVAVESLSVTDVKHSLHVIARGALERTHARDVHIYLYDQASDQLSFGTSLWASGEVDLEFASPRPDGLTATVARTGKEMIITDPSSHSIFTEVVDEWAMDFQIVGVPLKRGDEVVGVFNIAFDSTIALGKEVLHFLNLLAAQAAVAITTARLSEETRTGRDRLKAILDSIHDGILMLDVDGRLVMANPRAEWLLNMRVGEHIGQHYYRFLKQILDKSAPDTKDILLSEVREMANGIKENTNLVTRRRYTFKHPTLRAIEETSVAVVSDEDELLGRLFILRDRTQEYELESYRQEMSHMIVHDLRSPLSGIITGLLMAIEDLNVSTDLDIALIDTTLNVALTSANSLLRLVESILDVNKLETGEIPLVFTLVDLKALCTKVCQALEGTIAEAQIDLQIDIPDDLPAIVADADKVERILLNLLDNALRYTPQSGQARIGVSASPTHYTVSVIDTGEGIPPEYHERVFERFVQIDTTRRKRGSRGSGLGLTFCRLAVEAHGGRIWADTGPEGGAALYFTLPTGLKPSFEADEN